MRDIFGSIVNSGDTQLGSVSEDILPSTTDVIDIGGSSKRFRNGNFKSLAAETIECQNFTSNPGGDIVIGTGSNTCSIQSGGGVHSNAFIKTGGTNIQFLKADGTVDTSTYLTTTTAGTTYIAKTGGTMSGTLIAGTMNATAFVKSGGLSTEFLKANGNVDTNTYLTTPTSLQGAYDIGDGTISGTLITKPFVVKDGTAAILNAGTSITLGNTTSNTPISLIGNLTITNSEGVIPLKKTNAPAIAINTWSSSSIGAATVGLQITTLKTIVINAWSGAAEC